MDRARQIIYSVMMGFVLKYFLEHAYSLNGCLGVLDIKERIFYIVILTYFFANCFRYLFGIFRLTLMTDEKYEPRDEDWEFKNFSFNLKRLFVINSGLFEVSLFGVMVMLIFPHVNEVLSWKSAYLNCNTDIIIKKTNNIDWKPIVFNFYLLNFFIAFLDVAAIFLFKNTIRRTKSDFDPKEQMRCKVWLITGLIELFAFLLVLGLLLSQEQINFVFQFISISILTLLLIAESLGVWEYVVYNLIKSDNGAKT